MDHIHISIELRGEDGVAKRQSMEKLPLHPLVASLNPEQVLRDTVLGVVARAINRWFLPRIRQEQE